MLPGDAGNSRTGSTTSNKTDKNKFERMTGEVYDTRAPEEPSAPSTPTPPPLPTNQPSDADKAQFQRRTGEEWTGDPLSTLMGDLTAANGAGVGDRQKVTATDLLGIGGPGQGLEGQARLESRLARPPSYARPNTAEWFKWVLSLPNDPNDGEYSAALAAKQSEAEDALRKAGIDDPYYWLRTGKTNTDKATDAQINRDDQKERGQLHRETQAQRYAGVHLIGPDGGDIDPTASLRSSLAGQGNAATAYADSQADGPSASPSPSPSGGKPNSKKPGLSQGPVIGDPIGDPQALMKSGNVVFAGTRKIMTPYGVEVERADFMTADDAKNLSYGWNANQVAAFQQATKNKITGYMDPATQKDWEDLVKVANAYTKNGVPTNPVDLVNMAATAKGSSSGGSGGGGGVGGGGSGGGGSGGGGAGIPAGQARTFLDQVMQKYVGRNSNDAEAAAFSRDLNAAASSGNFDPQSWATSWVSSHYGKEGGSYQAASTYYQAMMSVLQGGV